MFKYYKHFLKNLSKDAADLHKLKGENFSELPDWAKKDFANIKQSLLDLEALAALKFTTLHKNPFIVGLDFSTKVLVVTLSQVQRGKDHQEHWRLVYYFNRKNTEAGKNYSSHKGEKGAFVWEKSGFNSQNCSVHCRDRLYVSQVHTNIENHERGICQMVRNY